MMRIGRTILGGLVFEDYTIYNDNVEDYLIMIDEQFVDLHKGIYTSLGFTDIKDFNLIVSHIELNNEIAREYFKKRPEVKAKLISLGDFKALFRFKNLLDFYDMPSRSVKKLEKTHVDQIVKLIANKPDHLHLAVAFLDNPGSNFGGHNPNKSGPTTIHNAVHSIVPGRDNQRVLADGMPGAEQHGGAGNAYGSVFGAANNRNSNWTSTLPQINDIAQYIANDKPALSAEVSALAAQRFESKLGLSFDQKKPADKLGKVPVISLVVKDENVNTLIVERDQLKEKAKEKDRIIEKLRSNQSVGVTHIQSVRPDINEKPRSQNAGQKEKLVMDHQEGYIPPQIPKHVDQTSVSHLAQSIPITSSKGGVWVPQASMQSFMRDGTPQTSSSICAYISAKKRIVTINLDEDPNNNNWKSIQPNWPYPPPAVAFQGLGTRAQDGRTSSTLDHKKSSPIYQPVVSTKAQPVLFPAFSQVDSQTGAYRNSPLNNLDLEFLKSACLTPIGTASATFSIHNDLGVRFTVNKRSQEPDQLSLDVELIHLGGQDQPLSQLFAQFTGDQNLCMRSQTLQIYKDKIDRLDTYIVNTDIQLLSMPISEVRLSISYSKNNLPEKKEIVVPIWPHLFAIFFSDQMAENDTIHYEAGLQKSIKLDSQLKQSPQTLVEQMFPHGYYNSSGAWTGMFCLLSFDLVFRFEIFLQELSQGRVDFKLYAHSRSKSVPESKLNVLANILLTNYEFLLSSNDNRN